MGEGRTWEKVSTVLHTNHMIIHLKDPANLFLPNSNLDWDTAFFQKVDKIPSSTDWCFLMFSYLKIWMDHNIQMKETAEKNTGQIPGISQIIFQLIF